MCVVDWMFVFSQGSCVEELTPNIAVFGDGTCEYVIKGLFDRAGALIRRGETPKLSLPCEDTEKVAICKLKGEASSETNSDGTLILEV